MSSQNKGLKYSIDYFIEELSLTTPSESRINLMPYLLELDYFEDIYSNSISGKVVLSESIGLLSKTGLNGTESIKVRFKKSKDHEEYIDRTFRVFSVSDRTLSKNYSFEKYVLEFCSEELFVSEQFRISKSYKGKIISDIIEDVMKNFLKVSGKSINIQKTTGTYDFVLPNKKIFETINWLSSYALPANGNVGADMLFFENVEGYIFASLQNLFNQSPVYQYSYNPKNITNLDMQYNLRTILKLEIMDYFDSLGSLNKGLFSNRLLSIDTINRKKTTTDFDYNDYFGKSKSLNDYPVTNQYKNNVGKTMYNPPDKNYESGTLRMVVSNQTGTRVDYIKNSPEDVPRDFFIEKSLPNRVAQIGLANHTRLKITVPGNSDLHAGMTVNLKILNTNPLSGMNNPAAGSSNVRTDDPHLSGKYLVSAIRHIISPGSYVSVIEVCKDSTYGPISGAGNKNNFI